MNILQVSTVDVGGGAEKTAWNLFQAYRARGHNSWLAVGSKRGNDSGVMVISDNSPPTPWDRFCRTLGQKCERLDGRLHGLLQVARACKHPRHGLEHWLGVEDFSYPGTRQILNMTPQTPDIVHCHNLHGGYFDLRALPWLS